jgi:hypothetical protein
VETIRASRMVVSPWLACQMAIGLRATPDQYETY